MKTLIAIIFSLIISGAALAQMTHDQDDMPMGTDHGAMPMAQDHGDMPMSTGTVTKIDSQWNRLTIEHGPLEHLDMPAMKMVFEVADPAMMEGLSEGQQIEFMADRHQGKLTVMDIMTE